MDEVIKSLEGIGSYEEVRDSSPGLDHDAFNKLRQLERAYEQLQGEGFDVSSQLRERRFQLLGGIADVLRFSSQGLEEYVNSRGEDLGDEPNIPEILRCASLIQEYTGKLNAPEPLLRDSGILKED